MSLQRVRKFRSLSCGLVAILLAVPTLVMAQETSLTIDSEEGDFIGAGESLSFGAGDGTYTASQNFDDGVTVSFDGDTHDFRMEFAPPEGEVLIAGPYEGATRFPFNSPTKPGLSVGGNGRGCNKSFGRFDVLEVEVDQSGQVIRFAADFEQHCESLDAPALHGSIRFQASGAPYPAPPDDDADGVPNTIDNCDGDANPDQADEDLDGIGDACDAEFTNTMIVLNSEEGDFIGQGERLSFFLIDGNITASRNFDSGVTIQFDGDDSWRFEFAAPGDVDLQVGTYLNATRFPFQAADEPGLSVSGAGRGCNTLTGEFEVRQVEYDGDGNVLRFAADFEQHCEGGDPALFGTVLFNAQSDSIFSSGFEASEAPMKTWTVED